MKKIFLLLATILCANIIAAQSTCTVAGQNPSTAFPVCGTSIFTQNTVPLCGGRPLPSPACQRGGLITDINPFWYKFTCFQSGSLGFLITPKNLSSDYDWELYDVTGKSPNDVYTDGTMVVGSNWSGETGLTGTAPTGQRNVCAGRGQPLFSIMPPIQAGHNYLLLVSHFSSTQFGYDLSFSGGTAVITDPSAPRIKEAEANCGGNSIIVQLSKKIKCNSIAADGSDFFITPGPSSSVSSVSVDCSVKFDTDSIKVTLNQFLTPGNYTLNIKQGSDGNTLLDYCDQAVPLTDIASFVVLPNPYTPMDNMAALQCSPNLIKLIFSKPINCASVAANGSDFIINGPYAASITNAKGSCTVSGEASKEILLTLSQPLQKAGNFTLVLRSGTDGNTIINECGIQTPAGASIAFSIQDTVNADFTYNIQYGCTEDIVDFAHAGQNGVTQWKWNLDDNLLGNQQNTQARYRVFEKKDIELIVTNGFCADTSRQSFVLDNFLKADFSLPPDNCHSEPISFKSTSTGRITQHNWQFGDGLAGRGDSLHHIYGPPSGTTNYTVRHSVTDLYGCTKTIEKTITIYVNCQIDVPNAFTPDDDMRNDLLYPLNAIKAEQLDFKVYNRWGQLIYQTNDWKKGWDGRYNGQQQPPGTYVWTLRFIHRDTKQQIQKKGSSLLIR